MFGGFEPGHTGRVADLDGTAGGAIAVAKHAKGEAVEGAQWYGLYDGSREDCNEEQAEREEQQHR